MNDDESVPFAPRKRTSIQLADKAEIDSLRAKLAAVDKQREDFFWDKQRAEAERDAMREALKEFERLLSAGICTTDAWRNARDKASAALAPSEEA